MSASVVLFVGGPLDGQVHAVEDGTRYVSAAEPVTEQLFAWDDPTPIHEIVTIRRVHYLRAPARAFGVRLGVFVLDGLPEDEAERLAADHLLSPLAKGVAA